MSRVQLFGVLVGGMVLVGLTAASQAAPPQPFRTFPVNRPTPAAYNPGRNANPPIGSDPRSWSPYPLNPYNPGGNGYAPIGSDPRSWSPYPLNPYNPDWHMYPPIGSDPRTWSPYPVDPVQPDLDPNWDPYPGAAGTFGLDYYR